MGAEISFPKATQNQSTTPLAKTVAKRTITADTESEADDEQSTEQYEYEAWPTDKRRYSIIGDAESKIASSRLAREFTMGTGFHHLTKEGNRAMFDSSSASASSSSSGRSKFLTRSQSQREIQTSQRTRPRKRNYYNEAAIALMHHNNLTTIGLGVRNHTYLRKVLLVTDAPHAIKIYIGDEDGPCVVGMALIRDGIVFTSGVLSEKYCAPLTLELDPERPIIDAIEMQSCTWLCSGRRGDVEKKISYLKISCGSNVMVFGESLPPGFDGGKSIYAPPEQVTGNLCISAIGYFDHKPISLQVVDLGADCVDVVDAMDTNVYYHNGVISGNITRSRKAEVEFLGSITTDQDHVWEVLEGCMDAIENSSPCHGELLPNAVDLLEEALSGDIEAIHSVLRMDRFLTHIIQEKLKIHTFQNDRSNFSSKLIPLKQMWGILSNTIERIKRVNNYRPVMNSFNVAFLEGTDEMFWQASFIFIFQLSLLGLVASYVWTNCGAIFDNPSPLKVIVSIGGTLVVTFLANDFKSNFDDFLTIFPDYYGTKLCAFDFLSNVVGGGVVVFCTFFLLLMTQNNLDVVLNATALLFVLELDEMMVDTNPIYIVGLYRAYFMKAIIKDLNESDKRYWDPSQLSKDRKEQYRIHLGSCSFYFPAK